MISSLNELLADGVLEWGDDEEYDTYFKSYREALKDASNPNTSAKDLKWLSEDYEKDVRREVAKNPNCPANVLENLAEDREWFVGMTAIENPNIPIEVLVKHAKDKHSQVQRDAALKVVDQIKSEDLIKLLSKNNVNKKQQ